MRAAAEARRSGQQVSDGGLGASGVVEAMDTEERVVEESGRLSTYAEAVFAVRRVLRWRGVGTRRAAALVEWEGADAATGQPHAPSWVRKSDLSKDLWPTKQCSGKEGGRPRKRRGLKDSGGGSDAHMQKRANPSAGKTDLGKCNKGQTRPAGMDT